MAKRPATGKCVHCLEDGVIRNWDHVFPESWYPDTTPANLEKWKIPSCIKCNNDLSSVEEDLMTRLAFCLDPAHLAAQGLVKRVKNSMDPSKGKGARDVKARDRKRLRFLAQLRQAANLVDPENPNVGVYPGLGERPGRSAGAGIPLLIPHRMLSQVCEKIVRGIVYLKDGLYIEPPFRVDLWVIDEAHGNPPLGEFETLGEEFSRANGIIIRRLIAPHLAPYNAYKIELWEQFKMFASVTDDMQLTPDADQPAQ